MAKANVREFFKASGRAEHTTATIGDVCNALEHAGVSAAPDDEESDGAAAPATSGNATAAAAPAAKHAAKKKR